MAEPEPFEVYAIRYATVARTVAENFIGGDPHAAGAPMDYYIWLVRNPAHTIVVDTGFNADAARRRGREFLRPPADGLRALGVDPATVTDVIVTHLHYDHIGNFDQFPRARFHVQDAEMAFATGRYMGNPLFAHSYQLADIVAMVGEVYAGRVVFHDGDVELVPGLSLRLVGGHTKGLQVVRIWTRTGWLVLASDASHYAANMIEGRPFPIVIDIGQMIDGWQRLRELAGEGGRIIPGHDPLVMAQYPAAASELAGIAVRLD